MVTLSGEQAKKKVQCCRPPSNVYFPFCNIFCLFSSFDGKRCLSAEKDYFGQADGVRSIRSPVEIHRNSSINEAICFIWYLHFMNV